MIKISDVKNKLKNDLYRLNNDSLIIIQCLKKDRSILIKKNDNVYYIEEIGFAIENQKFLDIKECYKFLLKRIRFEFPNSHNLWYSLRKNNLVN